MAHNLADTLERLNNEFGSPLDHASHFKPPPAAPVVMNRPDRTGQSSRLLAANWDRQ